MEKKKDERKFFYQRINSKSKVSKNDIDSEIDEEIKKLKNKGFREKYTFEELKSHPYENIKIPEIIVMREEWICKASLGKHIGSLGEIKDYQISLKVPGIDNKGRGKIDLISKKGNDVYLVEYKRLSNTEIPLKAIFEIYTYYRLLGGNIKNHKTSDKFIEKIICGKKGLNCYPVVLLTKKDNGDRNDKKTVYKKFIEKKEEYIKIAEKYGVLCYECEVNEKLEIINVKKIV